MNDCLAVMLALWENTKYYPSYPTNRLINHASNHLATFYTPLITQFQPPLSTGTSIISKIGPFSSTLGENRPSKTDAK